MEGNDARGKKLGEVKQKKKRNYDKSIQSLYVQTVAQRKSKQKYDEEEKGFQSDSSKDDHKEIGEVVLNEETSSQKKAKKDKNRVAAKRTRDKKKEYMQVLEDKVQQLTVENKNLKEELATYKKRAKREFETSVEESTILRNLMTNLAKDLQEVLNKNSPAEEIKTTIGKYKDKYTELIEKKRGHLKYTFAKVIDIIVPEFSKDILRDVIEKKGMFQLENVMKIMNKQSEEVKSGRVPSKGSAFHIHEKNPKVQEWNELNSLLRFTEIQKQGIMDVGVRIKKEALNLKELIVGLLKQKEKFYQVLHSFNESIMIQKTLLTLEQQAKYCIWRAKKMEIHSNIITILKLKPEDQELYEEKVDFKRLLQVSCGGTYASVSLK